MNQKYHINLECSDDELEAFEINDTNLAEIRIQLPDKQIVFGSKYKVELTLAPDAMIGFGTELIRKGLRLKEGKSTAIQEFEHISPLSLDSLCQKMGIFLTPKSCDLLIASDNFGKIDDITKQGSKEPKDSE